jgi:hypothetical protein
LPLSPVVAQLRSGEVRSIGRNQLTEATYFEPEALADFLLSNRLASLDDRVLLSVTTTLQIFPESLEMSVDEVANGMRS